MIREILFKAKRKDNGGWVEGFLFHCLNNGEEWCIGNEPLSANDYSEIIGEYRIWFPIDENTICQYTGLTDKNGNKVWENDVVKDTDIHLLGSVEYDEEHGMYVINEVNDGYQNFQEFWSCTEVIGNIFDNPELLKGGAE